MGFRDQVQFALDEIKKGKTEEDKRHVAIRVVAGWTLNEIETIKEDIRKIPGEVALALKRAINQKTGIKVFDLGGKR